MPAAPVPAATPVLEPAPVENTTPERMTAEPAPALPAPDEATPALPVATLRGWQVALSGWVQVDFNAWSQDSFDELDPTTGDPLNRQRFLIRRGRLRAEARRDRLFSVFELDGNTVDGSTARILAAHVGYTLGTKEAPLVEVLGGLFRVPFGFEIAMSEREKWFLEPPAFARAIIPGNYDAGVMARGQYGQARWAIALVNGAPVLDAQWRGRDPVSSFELVGRVGAEVELPWEARFAFGLSALSGTGLHPGDPPTKDQIEWVDENQDGIVQTTELRVVPGTPGTPSETFTRRAVGGDLQLHWYARALGAGIAFAEVALGTNVDRGLVYADPIAAGRDLRHLGYAVGLVQDLTPYAQLGVRFDRYVADRDAAERLGLDIVSTEQAFSTLAVVATARWDEARLSLQYDRERNPYGRDASGMPTTRAADRLTLRAQVGF